MGNTFTPFLTLEDLAIGYGGRPLLSGINLSIEEGDFWGIVGPNGAGKTTLIKTILGIIPPIQGRIQRTHGLIVGYVPQRGVIDDIFPLTTLDVVLMGRYSRVGLFKRMTEADEALALKYMDRVGIAHLESKPFRSLSGGQKQRALIARGLVNEADVLILDEPTDGMDIAGEAGIMELISALHRRFGRTIVMITHTLNLAANYAKKLMILHSDEGLFKAGHADELLNGETLKELYRVSVDVYSLAGRKFVLVQAPLQTGTEGTPWSS